MFRSNLNANIPINNLTPKKKDLYIEFSSYEKEEIISSLQFMGPDFENFVKIFYESFSEKNSSIFMQNKSEEDLINMLSTCLNLIVTSLEQPIPLDEYVSILIERHPNFNEIIKDKDLFVKSFLKSIVGTFKENFNDRLGGLCYRDALIFTVTMKSFLNC